MRKVALTLALLLATAAAAQAARGSLDRGVVQALSATQITLTEIDGHQAGFATLSSTKVRVNGRPAPLLVIRPGFVAAVVHPKGTIATQIRAFGQAPRLELGVVSTASARQLVFTRADGAMVLVRLGPATHVRAAGRALALAALAPGQSIAVHHPHDPLAAATLVVIRTGA